MKMKEFYKLKERVMFIHGDIDALIYDLKPETSNADKMKEINNLFREIYDSITDVSTEILENVFSIESTKRDEYISLIYWFFKGEESRIERQFAEIDDNDLLTLYDFDREMVFTDELEKFFIDLKDERAFVLDTYRHLARTFQRIKFVFYDFPKESLEISNESLSNNKGEIKIKWNASPSLIGFVFIELTKHGYIDLPSSNGRDGSYAGLAKLVYRFFDITGSKENNTTLENLIKEFNPNKNTLGIANRAKFTIPPYEKK